MMKTWISQLEKITEAFVTNFGALSEAQLNWKPNPGAWSIAQNIDHLIVVNETYYPVLASLKAGTYKTPFTGKIGFLVSFFGKTVLNAVKPGRRKKMKTFRVWEPAASRLNGHILKRFEHHQAELKCQIEASAELLEKGTVISSPASRNIVYRLATAFDIIVAHEQRHLEQAKEVLKLMGNNPVSNPGFSQRNWY